MVEPVGQAEGCRLPPSACPWAAYGTQHAADPAAVRVLSPIQLPKGRREGEGRKGRKPRTRPWLSASAYPLRKAGS